MLLVIATIGKSQTYPVNSFVTISPPYSSYLPDYSDPTNNQFKILLTLTDFAVPSYQVKLRIRINGNGYSMVTTDITNQIPITLSPGIPVEITGADLAPYLSSQNLTFEGLSFDEYETTKVLPGGPAMICVDVIDHNSANQTIIGNPACATHWFEKYDPPLINLPLCGSEITPTLPQQILFSWTPLSGASQNLFQTNYEFELWGPFEPGMDPNQIVNQTLPFYTEITNNSILSIGSNIPDLQVGKMYVWRVTASDFSGRDLYVNNGMTEVCHFVYGNVASSILGNIELDLNSNGTAKRQGKAWWNVSSDLESYVLELRKTGDENYEWFPYSTNEGELKINNLEPETEYECRVKGMLGGNSTEWSNTSVFTTLPNEEYVCGSNALPPSSQNMIPLDFLLPTNIVQVGQFEMEVTSADGTGTPGHFYGYGKINIPFMYINLNVEFDDLLIDENMMARGGQVDAITQGVDAWLEGQSTEYVDGTVESIDFNTEDSTVVVYLEDGEPLVFDWPTDGPITIVDDSGLIYTINPDGTVTITGAITWDNDNLDATANHQVIFKAADDQKYGFDELIYTQWTENYPCIKLSDNSKYFIPWKSVGASETDKLIAVVIDSADNPISNPTFVDEFGGQISATSLGNNKWELDLGIQTGLSKRIYAYDNQGKKVGKFNLIIYGSKNKDLVVVPLNSATAPDQATLEADINDIFDQAYTFFSVDKKDNWTFDYDVNDDGLDLASDDDNDLDRYSEEMKSIRDAYFEAHPDANKNAYYLFVVPEFSDPGQLGYMVRGKALGFIKAGASNKTYAHELGHALKLEHTFPQIEMAATNNLMDYSDHDSSIHLTAVQWKGLQEFSFALSFLDNIEDGGLVTISDISVLSPFKNVDGTYTFLAKSGKPITLPANITKVTFSSFEDVWKKTGNRVSQIGTLNTFTVNDSTFISSRKGEEFNGFKYKNPGSSTTYYYSDINTRKHKIKHIIAGLPCIKSGDNYHFYIYLLDKTSFPEAQSDFNYTTYFANGTLMDNEKMIKAFSKVTTPNGILVSATVSDSYSNELKSVLKHLNGVQCGLDFIYAKKSSFILEDDPDLYDCFENMSQLATNNFEEEIIYEYNISTSQQANAENIDDVPEHLWKINSSLKRSKKLYNLIISFSELISEKELTEEDMSELRFDELFHRAISKIWSWLYEEKDGTNFTQDQVDCILSKLNISFRLEIIKIAYETVYFGHLGSAKEKMIVDLIRTTPNKDDFDDLMGLLKSTENGTPIFWRIYDDCSGQQIADFVLNVTLKMLEFKYYEGAEDDIFGYWENPYAINAYGHQTPNLYPIASLGKLRLEKDDLGFTHQKLNYVVNRDNQASYKGNEITLTYSEFCKHCNEELNVQYASGGYSVSKNMFEWVRLDINSNFQFRHPYLGRNLKKGDFILVPAFYAYWLVDAQDFVDNTAVVRKLIAVAASILSVATMNPGPLLALELSWNAAELIVANYEDDILSSDNETAKAFIEFYNYASMAAGGYFLVKGVISVSKNLYFKVQSSTIRNRISAYKNDSQLSSSGYASELEPLKRYFNFISKHHTKIKNFKAEDLKNLRQMYYEAHFNQFGLDLKEVSIHIEDGVAGDAIKIVDGQGAKAEIGGMQFSDEFSAPYAQFESGRIIEREIVSSDEILGELDGITYNKSGDNVVKGDGKIQIIKNEAGEIKIKILESGLDYATFASKFINDYPLIHAWLVSNTVPLEILTKLDDWLKNGLTTRLINFQADLSSLSQTFITNPNLIDSWILLDNLGTSFVKSDPDLLGVFHKLSLNNRNLVKQFTDIDANSTLSKFLRDCKNDPEFIIYINNPANELEVRGFLSHKEGMITPEENKLISEMLNSTDEIGHEKVREWLEYGERQAIFKSNREAGNTFGNLIKNQLSSKTSNAYLVLKQKLANLGLNLDDYSIYGQVQLCLKGDCLSKGNYWIPDFMLVVERNGPNGKYLETIIVDSKLSESTGWTKNQNAANGMSEWAIKSVHPDALIHGSPVNGFSKDAIVSKNGNFIKIYNESGILKTD
ncbi:MAG: fibronectin type III domain-containing protein [Crocinitomicaceae bacterium]